MYLAYEILDGLITTHSARSQLIFDEFLEKMVSNKVSLGLGEIVHFLFEVEFAHAIPKTPGPPLR